MVKLELFVKNVITINKETVNWGVGGSHANQGRRWSLNKWVLSLLWKMASGSAVLTLVGSLFHHWGARTDESLDFAEWPTLVCSQRWWYQPARWCSGAMCSCWGKRSDHCLGVDECSCVGGLEGQYHRHATGSQWRSRRRVTRENLSRFISWHAATFWIRYSCVVAGAEIPGGRWPALVPDG